jgi:aromatic ring-opening dioxygenase catalytic subunit (LigB family)
MAKLPSLYIPHGGGPCFFMEWDPPDTWARMGAWLRGLAAELPRPKAVLVVSAHWEEAEFVLTGHPHPPLIYDYYGFPEHTYRIEYPAPGAPALAEQARGLLAAAGLPARIDAARGYDHGVFIPFKLILPQADIPIVQLSLRLGLDPEEHLRAGVALAPLREQGVLIVGSGMSYHNMEAYRRGLPPTASGIFDAWLTNAATDLNPLARDEKLAHWSTAPAARDAHPREEHLIPLMVAAGAAGDDVGQRTYSDRVMGSAISAYQFG